MNSNNKVSYYITKAEIGGKSSVRIAMGQYEWYPYTDEVRIKDINVVAKYRWLLDGGIIIYGSDDGMWRVLEPSSNIAWTLKNVLFEMEMDLA